MFLVFNKEKIYAYVISVLTVVLLFFIANTSTEDVEETSSNTSKIIEYKTNLTENKTNNTSPNS